MLTRVKDRAGPADRIGRIRVFLPAVPGPCMVLAAFGKSPDRQAYDGVVAAMAVHEAGQFLERYPRSSFRDRLVGDIISRCRREGPEECSEMILGVVTKDRPR